MKFIKSDITNETDGCLLQGVNTLGYMNSGLAKAIRAKWPEVYEQFKANGTGKQLLGTIHILDITDDLKIINGYTQEKCGNDGAIYADVQSVDSVIRKACLYAHLYDVQLKTVKIGCGLGGLDWENDVKPVIEKYEAFYNVEVWIYEL